MRAIKFARLIIFQIWIVFGCVDGLEEARSKKLDSLKPSEFVYIHRLTCQSNRTLKAIAEQNANREKIEEHRRRVGCAREPQAWRWYYFDEMEPHKHAVLLREHSIDERLANIIYTTLSSKMFEIDGFKFNSGNPDEDSMNMELVAGKQVDDQQCGQQLSQMLASIEELRSWNANRSQPMDDSRDSLEVRHIQLARVLDSFGRYEANHLTGRFMSLGSYEQCQRSQLPLRQHQLTGELTMANMRFCWARHKLDQLLDESLRSRRKTTAEPKSNVLLSGVCLPEVCHSKSFAKHKDLLQRIIQNEFRLPKSIYANETLEVESIFCLVDDTSSLAAIPVPGKVLSLVLACYLLFTVFVTLYSIRQRSRHSNDIDHQKVDEDEVEARLAAAAEVGRDEYELTSKEEAACNGAARKFAASRGGAAGQANYWGPFDLTESWQDFIGRPREQTNGQGATSIALDTINPIKVFCCAFVVYGHSLVAWYGFMMDEISAIQGSEKEPYALFALSGTVAVDTFFVISGLMVTYLALKRFKDMDTGKTRVAVEQSSRAGVTLGIGNELSVMNSLSSSGKVHKQAISQNYGSIMKRWLFLTLVRYLRIVPMFFLVHALKRLVLLYIGSGPLWDHGLSKDTSVGACKREPWFVPLTPISAYISLTKQCILPSWSLSNEIMFCFFSPPLILLLYKRPRLAHWLAIVLCIVSLSLGQVGLANVRSELWEDLVDARTFSFTRILNEYSYLYTSPEYRVCSLIIGLLGGYKLFKYSLRQKDSPKVMIGKNEQKQTNTIFSVEVSQPMTYLSFIYIVLTIMLVINLPTTKHLLQPYHTFLIPYWLNVSRMFWSVANVFIFLRMMTDWRNTALMRMFASSFWKAYSRLAYGILLIHFDLLAYVHISSPRTINSSMLNSFIEASGVYLLCLPLSVFLFVVFENPINKFIKLLLFRQIKNK